MEKMQSTSPPESRQFETIRKKAEMLAREQPIVLHDEDPDTYRKLLHEFRVHQIELEMQNEALRESQIQIEVSRDRFLELFHTAPVGFIILDSSGVVAEANMTFGNMIGMDPADMVNRPFDAFLESDSKTAFLGKYKSFFKNPADKRFDVTLVPAKDTERVIRLVGNREIPSRSSGPDEMLRIAAIDITELKQSEQRQAATIEKLMQANRKIRRQQASIIEQERLKVLLQMAGATAHELSQPLMALLGGIELLALEADDAAKRAHHVKLVKDAGERIAGIIKKIQTIRNDRTKAYAGGGQIINLDEDVKILHVDDESGCRSLVKKLLHRQGISDVFPAATVAEAKVLLMKHRCDLVLTDYKLPDGDGFDVIEFLQTREPILPVIMLTGLGNEKIASQAIKTGAYDYLSKENINAPSLSRSIATALEKYRLNAEINQAMKKMAEMSAKDELTGLYNRRYFNEAMESEIARAARYRSVFSLCLMDIDHFKRVNDNHGHSAGDAVLSAIGRLLSASMRKNDLVCRFGGEEFAIILPHTDLENARQQCGRLRETVAATPFRFQSTLIYVTISIGIASFDPAESLGPEELIANADKALYRAKTSGRNRVAVHKKREQQAHEPKTG